MQAYLPVISLLVLVFVVAIGFIKKMNNMFKTLFLLSVANVAINVLMSWLGVFNLGHLFY